MFLNEYKIITPSIVKDGYMAIKDFDGKDITKYTINKLGKIVTEGTRVALLYLSGGYPLDDNETYLTDESKLNFDRKCMPDTLVYKKSIIKNLGKWVNNIKGNIVYTNLVSNTCATGIYAIEQAKFLLEANKVDEVVIVGETKIHYNVMRLFKEHRIPLTLGEGAVVFRLSNKQEGYYIDDIKTHYAFHTNPFYVSAKEYAKVLSPADIVKPHSTFTEVNTRAEDFLGKYDTIVTYKQNIGHTLGISSLLETGMLLGDNHLVNKKAIIIASGMGGFYGSFTIQDYS